MLTGPIAVACLIITCAGAVAALLANEKEERTQQASETYRLIMLRNGVTEEVPFSSSQSLINVPGMVEVQPHSRRADTPIILAASTAPVPAPAQLKPPSLSEKRRENKAKNEIKVSPKKETKFYKDYPQGHFQADDPSPAALDALHHLVAIGEKRKTVLSWAVFGSYGGKTYSEAKPLIEQALKNAK